MLKEKSTKTPGPESKQLLQTARSLRTRIEALADQIERDRRLPQALADELAEAGFFKMLVPKDYGGSQLSPEEYLLVVEELAKIDASTAWVVALLACNSISAGYLPPHIARALFSDSKAAVSGSLAPALREPSEPPNQALVVAGGYQLSGRWSFSSGCMHATLFIAHCPVWEDGKPRFHDDGLPEKRWFYFPVGDGRIVEDWSTMGLRGTGSHGFVVKDLFVASEMTLPGSSTITPVHPAPLYAYSAGTAFGGRHLPLAGVSAATIAAVCLGIARGMIDAFVEISGVSKGVPALKDSLLVQDKVGRAEATLRAARAYMLDTQRQAWNSILAAGCPDSDLFKDLALAGAHVGVMTAEAVDLIWSAAAITGVFVPGPFERRFRDIHVATQNGGISPSLFGLYGRCAMDRAPS